MTLEYRCSNCGTLLQTTNADAVDAEIERLNRDVEFWKSERDVAVNHAVTFGPEIAKRGAENERLQADNRRWSKVADERSMQNTALRQENERLRAALEVLKELHALLDFEEPLTDKTPWLFEDASDINAAFVKAYAVIVENRAAEQRADDAS